MQKIMTLDRQEKLCQGVTLSQHHVIDALHRKQTLTMNELSREVGVAVSTLTRSIDVLVRDGIVARRHSEQDRRKVCIELTEKGREKGEMLRQCAEYFWGAVLAAIPDEKKQEISRDLRILMNALEQADESHCPRFRIEKRSDK
jgi:DNA-binding MarR family transcriptional regulator